MVTALQSYYSVLLVVVEYWGWWPLTCILSSYLTSCRGQLSLLPCRSDVALAACYKLCDLLTQCQGKKSKCTTCVKNCIFSGCITAIGRCGVACCRRQSCVVCLSVAHDHEPSESGWTDRDVIWDIGPGWAEGNHWWRRNTTEPSVCIGSVALCQIKAKFHYAIWIEPAPNQIV